MKQRSGGWIGAKNSRNWIDGHCLGLYH